MKFPRSPRYTDLHRYPRPYTYSEASAEPGYLAARFAEIRAEQAAATEQAKRDETERAAKLRPMKRSGT